MTTPAELLAVASGAVVATMGTDAYQFARERVARLIRRDTGDPSQEANALARLDALEEAVAVTAPEERAQLSSAVAAPVTRLLEPYVGFEQREWVQDLVEELRSRRGEAQQRVINRQTVTGNFSLGSINTAGRDNNIVGGDR